MTHRFTAAALALALAVPATAQVTPAPPAATAPPPAAPAPPPAAPQPATVRVAIVTSMGQIVLELEKDRAPVTTANFLKYVNAKRLPAATFYRATKIAPGYGLIQFGVQNAPKLMLPPIAHEPTTQTHLSHTDGTISMARNAPGSAAGDFFITIGDLTAMDADPTKPGDNLGFAAFGRVVEGMDVVRAILEAPTSPTLGEGVMKGQMIAAPVKILSAKVAG